MTRAEQAALKEYPISTPPSYIDGHNLLRQEAFIKGYQQAEKETIGRAIKWLEEHADSYNGSESAFDHMEEEMITDFRKAMEEEQ